MTGEPGAASVEDLMIAYRDYMDPLIATVGISFEQFLEARAEIQWLR